MDRLIIQGGVPLHGVVRISGAKNAVLPLMAASLLLDGPLVLHNVPRLADVSTMSQLLNSMGVSVSSLEHGALTLNAASLQDCFASYDIVSKMRASILVLGPMLARFGHAKVAFPGGCAIGSRPVNMHTEGLEKMGATITIEGGYIHASVQGRLKNADIVFDKVSVTGTENLMMAATLAEGVTTLHNAAMEPEVVDLARCLKQCGAQIEGEGTTTISITGVEKLKSTTHTVVPDRIEAATYLIAGAVTLGEVKVIDMVPEHILPVIERLRAAGAVITVGDTFVHLTMEGRRPRAVSFSTAPYPAYPTDAQAQLLALNAMAQGHATVTETVFENRFMHVDELMRMGANIRVKGQVAECEGVDHLKGAPLKATDLRASACLVLAGLAATGETAISKIYHIDRGYECIDEKLSALGARIYRVHDVEEFH